MQSFFFCPPARTILSSSSRAYCSSYSPIPPHLSFQISNFSKMNRGGNRRNRGGHGWSASSNRGGHGWSTSSNPEPPHHRQEQDSSSIFANVNKQLSRVGTSHQRQAILNIVKGNNSRNPQEKHILKERGWFPPCNEVISSSETVTGDRGYARNTGYPRQPCEARDVSMVGPSKVGWDGDIGHQNSEHSEDKMRRYKQSSQKTESAFFVNTNSPAGTVWMDAPGSNSHDGPERRLPLSRETAPKVKDNSSVGPCGIIGHSKTSWSNNPESLKNVIPHPDCSKKENLHYSKISPNREHNHSSSGDLNYLSTPFDICAKKGGFPVLKSSLFEKNKEKRKQFERLVNDPQFTLLRPGMILLKNYISCADQIEIVKNCRKFGIGKGGFYQPGYKDGAKLHLHMMCLGKDWDLQKRIYDDVRSNDGSRPPFIPAEFRKLVSEAIRASNAIICDKSEKNLKEAIPSMEPDICIVNFYTESGKLGLHQDRDESRESIAKGLPVVSFSIGDSAEFLYGDDRDVDKAEKVELKSGDVLIFGGQSRLIFHGVPTIIPKSAPKFLADEANLRPGRLNLTFRKY